eukprot:SAG11_NODE_1994_length_3953_cov_2.436430_2_plen_59_part_00
MCIENLERNACESHDFCDFGYQPDGAFAFSPLHIPLAGVHPVPKLSFTQQRHCLSPRL